MLLAGGTPVYVSMTTVDVFRMKGLLRAENRSSISSSSKAADLAVGSKRSVAQAANVAVLATYHWT